MSDIVKRLREHCMFTDWQVAIREAHEAAARIEQLEAALKMFACECQISERCAVPDNCRNFQARRILEDRT